MNDRGTVLITVLWVIVVLSIISFSLAAAVRSQVDYSRAAFDSESAFFQLPNHNSTR